MITTQTPFAGLMGTHDFIANERVRDYQQKILELAPNGKAPLLALTSLSTPESATDPKINWFERAYPDQTGDVVGVYLNAGLTTAYTGFGGTGLAAEGSILYIKLSAAQITSFRKGYTVQLTSETDPDVAVEGRVIDKNSAGASSNIAVELFSADVSTTLVNDLSDAEFVYVTGSGQAEGSAMSEAIYYKPYEMENYTQIFETSLDLTRTVMQTKLRTKDKYLDAKSQALLLHGEQMESAMYFGHKKIFTGENGKPERYMRGIIPGIAEFCPANIVNFETDSIFTGKTWTESGEAFVDKYFAQVFRFGSSEKLGLLGSEAALGFKQIAATYGAYEITANSTEFGFDVMTFKTPFGIIQLKTAPLLTLRAAWRSSMLIVEPSFIKRRPMQDTKFKKDPGPDQGGNNSLDGKKESFLTEQSFEVHHHESMMYMKGIGRDNALT